jgi:DNA-formamidopyrimidine glycosylase
VRYTETVPEGPEVRRTADWLKSNLGGCVVRSVNEGGRFAKQPIKDLEKLKSKKVVGVRCRGKVIVLDFEEDVSAISTLGMSGMWTRAEAKHTALTLWCELPPARGILPVHYVDQRRFGNFTVVDNRTATSRLDDLGWDALADPASYGKVRVRALKYMKRSTPVCQVLLDQEVFAGVGNYIRAEALYRAKVNPWTEWRHLNCGDEARLCHGVANVMRESYSRGGATLETFYDGDGNRGDQVDFLEVYGKTHDSHGNPVERMKDKSGRTVWWVPGVQLAGR